MQEGLLTPAIATTVTRLTSHVLDMPLRARDLDLDEWLAKPNPAKWSKLEILGHLVDSAINNLKRFTDVQYLPQPYRITPYQQDDLVTINAYQQLPFDHILQMWIGLNQQILYVIANLPADKLSHQVIIPNGEVKTLGWWIDDYADHMEHHLRQIFYPKT
ncbi:DinB family protein [Pseudobacter ginsenosidimutans]|uniref:DinB family protein n=1 Tax=Pseudobacter ginsenosidimutans TaxID=661488 RepID=A0A4Q7MWU6_9BACT|nr:DinB family protein [Pseudobacter ginsenosidimutans]QEC40740.1 DinB family protein [Pseudobacter ginsenosidimutans]RZS72534.1 DinB family protein [Pseudobacter ginsenosidimutans]